MPESKTTSDQRFFRPVSEVAIQWLVLGGIIGLFVGAVVPALGYKLYLSWINS